LAAKCVDYLEEQANLSNPGAACIGLTGGEIRFTDLEEVPRLMDWEHRRPKRQWWMDLRPIARMLAQPSPQFFQKMESR